MAFNSIAFASFFILFFILFWFILNKNLKAQNLFLLIASYAFYAWAEWHFLFLLIASSVFNYFLGIYIGKTSNEKQKRLLLYLSLLQGVGTLVIFKYLNFFIVSIVSAFSTFHISLDIHTIQIFLPLGISFYTFRTLSYVIDIYQNKTKPVTDWVVFFSYVAFFPCIISGPIDRTNLLIPQLERKRVFDYGSAVDGLRQILWGFFKKMVIADNCAIVTNQIFDNYHLLSASTLVLGAFLYTIELYADFSGYTDMAIGFARLLGFNVTKNFNYPFFAQNIVEYWRRWHISLTSWVTDYVFTPLSISFRDYGNWGLILAIVINMIVVGIWHGANWTFVLYGFISGLYFIPFILLGKMKQKKRVKGKMRPSLTEVRNILGTFLLLMFTNIIFRADTVKEAFEYYRHLFSMSIFTIPSFYNRASALTSLCFIVVLILIEWLQRDKDYGLQLNDIKINRVVRWAIYYSIIIAIVVFKGGSQQFIYVQF